MALDRIGLARQLLARHFAGRPLPSLAIPTNLTLLDATSLALLRQTDVEVWVGIDQLSGPSLRRTADGRDISKDVVEQLRVLLAATPAPRVTARMTLTPANVRGLSRAVRALAGLGVRRISHLPALDVPWDRDAIAAWGEEHRRIALWLRGARSLGTQVPNIVGIRAIADRLQRGTGRLHCGAGLRSCAVGLQGQLAPCHRFLVAPGAEPYMLGNLLSGELRTSVWERFSQLDPESQKPEEGRCADCSGVAGCTHFCPAHGHLAVGQLDGVPRVACALMRAQVDAVREMLTKPTAPRHGSISVRIAGAVLMGAAAAAACGGDVAREKREAPTTDRDLARGATDAAASDATTEVGQQSIPVEPSLDAAAAKDASPLEPFPDAGTAQDASTLADAGGLDATVPDATDEDAGDADVVEQDAGWWQGCIG